MSWPNVISFDGGLATCGAVVMGARHQCRAVEVFTSATKAAKWDLNMVVDLTRRARELAIWIEGLIIKWQPKLVLAEEMGVFANARKGIDNRYVQILNSIAWGVLVAEVQRRLLPMHMVVATTCRKTVCGRSDEALAQTVAMQRHPSYVEREADVRNELKVHARDALCVYEWGIITGKVGR